MTAIQPVEKTRTRDLIAAAKKRETFGKLVPHLLLAVTCVTILATFGIVFTLLKETLTFFGQVKVVDFLFGTEWAPFSNAAPAFGVLPLVVGTLKIAGVALLVSVPAGLACALFLSEYASPAVKKFIKPIIELLAGIPTIVYGFFALTFVTPWLQSFIPALKLFNALSAGIVVGIMILPMIVSLSEDALSAVPASFREGAYGLGATKFETAVKVVFPAAISGIAASIILAASRAIGETMIVSLAAGSTPAFDLDLTGSIQTMTSYIVQVATGDAGYGTTIYYSIYAVGFTLFLFTFAMNRIALFIKTKFREEY
ncbi:phosphate ABC transporter permease [Bacillus sp. OxB-1]|uniref:phosphate ABC transporter permease subunit PstC n=1 Tax=Bacillus sp. (strain OxB-1) TaxID=98228 RepID=UPI000581D9E5|nr:phosphate ABC transporter permease subunit PstC [Bacillus sp. OxB-1]BAQ09094.1 phosphate ABC transporter permease [Bacillus sp. OxB-1]